jgi:hypothetical protein
VPVQTRLDRTTPVTPTNQLPTYLTPPTQARLDALPLTLNMLKAEPSNSLAQFGFLSNITSFQSWGSSTYNGLAVQGTRRFAAGLQFVASYTWSHLIDNSTADVFSTVLTPPPVPRTSRTLPTNAPTRRWTAGSVSPFSRCGTCPSTKAPRTGT